MLRLCDRPSKAQSKTAFRPHVGTLEGRTVLSTINIPVPINTQVLNYALNHVNQQVGDGQCGTLAQYAIASANGVPFYNLGPTGSNADYVWGHLVTIMNGHGANLSVIQPGDIIQFRNVSTTDTATFVTNGKSTTDRWYESYTHHTAIVESVNGGNIELLEQNANGYMKVQAGTVWGTTFTTHSSAGNTQITVTHTFNGGTMWVYQPYTNIHITLPF